jgi:hypothetical protein
MQKDRFMRKRLFSAEIIFPNPHNARRGAVALAAARCTLATRPELRDGDLPTVYGVVTGETVLDQNALGDWLIRIVEPAGGDVVEWGFGLPTWCWSPARYRL